jgi:hypothetical protein
MTHATANTILAQLGGGKFLAMTGARDLLSFDTGLIFALPRGAKNKANKVRVTLDASDTYTVEFFRFSGRTLELTPVGAVAGVYADNLRPVFTEATGLHCTL